MTKKKTAKPKRRTRFQKLIARIERSNKTFKKAGQAKKILMVAQDVLDLLSLKRINAYSGFYVQMPALPTKVEGLKDISEFLKLPRLPACDVCAIGAGMVAATIRLNHVPIAKNEDDAVQFSASFNHPDGPDKFSVGMSDRAREVFPQVLLRDMESAFEHNDYGYDQDTDEDRLKAIYGNLVKNKGKKFTTDCAKGETPEVVWSVGKE